ncbi:MAG: DUF4246 domain-containing protein [Polyangiaceae bacterium]|jgi:hypothetical protein|nr:DUF4246 domain-containing protein [Polyangiaceae bacterium]
MSEANSTPRGTDFSFIRMLLEHGEEYAPQPGDVINLEYSYIDPKHKGTLPRQGKAEVLASDSDTLTLRVEHEGRAKATEHRVNRFDLSPHVEVSPTILKRREEHQQRPDPDGVVYRDRAIPGELRGQLREHIQQLSEQEPIDYHPGSGTRVRDLVHPSLYPYIQGRSVASAPLPEPEQNELDRFGRPFEGSRYQWLPTPFKVADDGTVTIESYINNLDRSRYAGLYDDLAQLFSIALPMIEGVVGYIDQLTYNEEDEEADLPDVKDPEPVQITPRSLRGRELQVIPKIVEYRLGAGETHEGVWHVEGMSHEHIVATCVVVLDRDEELEGGSLSFKRSYTKEEAGMLFWNISQSRPEPTANIVSEGTIPLGTVGTPSGRMLVFPNSHIHKLNTLRLRPGAAEGRRRVIVFWIVDPDVQIPSTREIPPQQGVIPHDEALEVRLALMEERRLHKTSFNPRAVSLCEH